MGSHELSSLRGTMFECHLFLKGGKGSGNWGHAGRKGLVGGSSSRKVSHSGNAGFIGAAPYRNVSHTEYGELKARFSEGAWKGFSREVKDKAKGLGINIKTNNDAAGAWMDSDLNEIVFEPSKRIETSDISSKVDVLAAQLGKSRNQQGMYIAKYKKDGKGAEHVIKFQNDRQAFEHAKKLEQFGLYGLALDVKTNSLYIGDDDLSSMGNVQRFYREARKNGGALSIRSRKADIRFIDQSEYDDIINGVKKSDIVDRAKSWENSLSQYKEGDNNMATFKKADQNHTDQFKQEMRVKMREQGVSEDDINEFLGEVVVEELEGSAITPSRTKKS